MDFDKMWAPVASVIKHQNMNYDEAVTIGSQFGKLQVEIERLEQKNQRYCEAFDTKNKVHEKLNTDYVKLKKENGYYRNLLQTISCTNELAKEIQSKNPNIKMIGPNNLLQHILQKVNKGLEDE